MTTSRLGPASTTTGPSRTHRALGWAAVAGTVPYLALKAVWLTGGTLGITDPAALSGGTMAALNAITVTMDAVVVVLALALTHRWGDRLPAWLVLLPMWVGTGFLVPMALAILPATALSLVAPSLVAGTATNTTAAALAPWVQPLVYGGFAWQGIFLGAAFVAYVRRRWSDVVTVAAAPSRALAPLLQVITAGGAVMAALSAGLHLVLGATSGSVVVAGTETINAGLAVAGAAGVVALVLHRATSRWLAATAAWTGSAAMFSWGLYSVALALVDTPVGAPRGMAGMAQLTGLLGGFALAVAGLLALAGTGVAHPAPRPNADHGTDVAVRSLGTTSAP